MDLGNEFVEDKFIVLSLKTCYNSKFGWMYYNMILGS